MIMSIDKLSMVENRLVGRRDVQAIISYTKPLTRDEVKKLIADRFRTDPAKVVVRKAEFITGTHTVKVHAHIYEAAEQILKFEPKHILIRNKLAEKEKK
ncbi:MAG: hypothetical protein QXY50_03905, partial [Candidatus Caldarchaeum sp.]